MSNDHDDGIDSADYATTGEKLSLLGAGAVTGALAMFGGPVGLIIGGIGMGIYTQRVAMKSRARMFAEQTEETDDKLVDEVARARPKHRHVEATHEFGLKNDAIIPIWGSGRVTTTYDTQTGEKRRDVDVSL